MSTQTKTIDYIVEQAAGAGSLTAKKMFGDYGLYCDGKLVALVCDDQLFVKPTRAGRDFLGTVIEARPYPTAKPCFLVDSERWDDSGWLSKLIQISAADLPAGKPRKKKHQQPRTEA